MNEKPLAQQNENHETKQDQPTSPTAASKTYSNRPVYRPKSCNALIASAQRWVTASSGERLRQLK
ncbi:hypothetical protein ACFE35_27640 [Phormidesmis priestleyi ANT.L61.2]